MPLLSNAMEATTVPLRFNKILVTSPLPQANGILSARIETRIKLHISFHPGSSIQFLKLPKTPSVHCDSPSALEQSLKFSLELRGSAGGAIIQYVCSKCKERKDQATRDIVDFRAQSTTVAIENGAVSIEFSIKCYPQHHGLDHSAFHIDAILQDHYDNIVNRARLSLLVNISGKGKQPVRVGNARRAVRGVYAQRQSLSAPGIIPSASLSAQVHGAGLASIFPGDDHENDNNNQQLPWVDSTTGVASCAGLFHHFTLPTPTLFTIGDLQQPIQFPQPGVNSLDIGPPVGTHRSPDRMHEDTLPGSERTPPVLPFETVTVPGSILVEPQCRHGVRQAPGVPQPTSGISNESSSGTSGAPDALSALPSRQGRSIPLMPLTTQQLQSDEPEGTHSGDTNQVPNEIFLEEVLPERGPMTGGIHVAIFGENFPSTPLYVVFGENWVRARRRDARTLRCRLPPSNRAGVVRVTLSQTPSGNAPEVGWSNATFEYEDTRTEAQLSMLKSIYQKAGETMVQKIFATVQHSLATMNTHPNPSLNTRVDHSPNHEEAETAPRPEEVNLEEISIHFLRTYSIHPNWKQIISSCNDYGQTMAHISITLGYLRLLRHLSTWEIDLNVVDNTGLTALHYAYLFKQEECAKFLIHSGVDQFILDDLGRSPSDLDPSLEIRLRSNMDTDSDNHAEGVSPIEYDTEVPDEAGQLYAKRFLVQQWMRQGEDERRGEVPASRCQSLETLGLPRSAGSPPALGSADEGDWGAMYDRSSPFIARIPKENSTPTVTEEMNPGSSKEVAVSPRNPPPSSSLSELSAQTQEAIQPFNIGPYPFSLPDPLGTTVNAWTTRSSFDIACEVKNQDSLLFATQLAKYYSGRQDQFPTTTSAPATVVQADLNPFSHSASLGIDINRLSICPSPASESQHSIEYVTQLVKQYSGHWGQLPATTNPRATEVVQEASQPFDTDLNPFLYPVPLGGTVNIPNFEHPQMHHGTRAPHHFEHCGPPNASTAGHVPLPQGTSKDVEEQNGAKTTGVAVRSEARSASFSPELLLGL